MQKKKKVRGKKFDKEKEGFIGEEEEAMLLRTIKTPFSVGNNKFYSTM